MADTPRECLQEKLSVQSRAVVKYINPMGTLSSKNEKINFTPRTSWRSWSINVKCSQDDMQSKSTQLTDESSLTPIPVVANVSKRRRSTQHRHSLKSSLSNYSKTPTTNGWNSNHLHQAAEEGVMNMPPRRQDSKTDPPQWPADSSFKTIPVKLPTNHHQESSDQQESEARYLAKMYDSRTWEMYRRITEARKNSSYISNKPPENVSSDTEWEHLQQDVESSPSGHEMIFLFDFD